MWLVNYGHQEYGTSVLFNMVENELYINNHMIEIKVFSKCTKKKKRIARKRETKIRLYNFQFYICISQM